MRALLPCLLVCLSLLSCKKDAAAPADIFVRVRNASQYPLENIVVKLRNYGALGVGQSSDYQLLEVYSSLPTVTVMVHGKKIGFTSIIDGPFVEEAALEAGRYTYVLNVIKTPSGEEGLVVSREKP